MRAASKSFLNALAKSRREPLAKQELPDKFRTLGIELKRDKDLPLPWYFGDKNGIFITLWQNDRRTWHTILSLGDISITPGTSSLSPAAELRSLRNHVAKLRMTLDRLDRLAKKRKTNG